MYQNHRNMNIWQLLHYANEENVFVVTAYWHFGSPENDTCSNDTSDFLSSHSEMFDGDRLR